MPNLVTRERFLSDWLMRARSGTVYFTRAKHSISDIIPAVLITLYTLIAGLYASGGGYALAIGASVMFIVSGAAPPGR
jgi:hypothetical protein